MDLSKIENLYNENIKIYGCDPKSVGWGTKEKQDLRFAKLLQVIDDKSLPFTINELGCGYGELVNYCTDNGYNLQGYIGVDISENMILAAKDYIKFSNATFDVNNKFSSRSEFVITSGVFNVYFGEDVSLWEKHIKDTLEYMFEMCIKGISFNLLTNYVDYTEPNLYYADPIAFFDFCKRNLSKKVTLIHDYELYEWTITVKK